MTKSKANVRDEFDIVIIGAGPSAIGLVYGLLLPYTKTQAAIAPPFRIAIVERGSSFDNSSDNDNDDKSLNEIPPQVQDPKSWFCAAHPSSNAFEKLYKKDEKPYSSIVYRTVPQGRGLGNRILSVPTGQGLGGGTNINACLFVRPAKDDFVHWPDYWRESIVTSGGGDGDGDGNVMRPRMMQSVMQIENVMRQNGTLIDEKIQVGENICNVDDEDDDDAMDGVQLYLNYEKVVLTECKEKEDTIWRRRWKLDKVTSTVRKKDVKDSCDVKGNNFQRVNYYQGILKPLLDKNPKLRESLYIFTSVLAERLLMHHEKDCNMMTARGVECSTVGTIGEQPHVFTIRAKIVVVCAGSILTPALLLASGIGGERELKEQGVTPLLQGKDNHWNGVGKRLSDHVIVATGFWTKRRFPSVDGPNSVRGWLAMDIIDNRSRRNLSSSFKHGARVLLKVMDGSSSSSVLPGVIASTCHRIYSFEPHFVCRFLNVFLYILSNVLSFLVGVLLRNSVIISFFKRQTFQILICLMNPSSKGTISIKQSEKGDNSCGLSSFDIQIDPAYMRREEDFTNVSLGIHVVEKLASCWMPNSIQILPGFLYKWIGRLDYLRRYVSDFALPYYHWSGSCSMKSDLVSEDSYVVDEQLRVRMTTNLYICDASVHPKIISAPPALTLAAMGLTVSGILHSFIRPKID